MGRYMYIDSEDFGLSKSHKHIIYASFKDKFKERKYSGLSAYVSKKDCEEFISNGRFILNAVKADPYTNDEFKQNFLEKFKFYDTDVFSVVYKYFKEALERFEEIYWNKIFYESGKWRKMFITYN